MTLRRGQVALYLVLVLVAITILVMMNVSTFVFVRAKNRAMNAGDAAALTAANWQKDCLNRIGDLNLEHLNVALQATDEGAVDAALRRCEEIVLEQKRVCLLDPMKGISKGNVVARQLGAVPNEAMRKILKDHVDEIRNTYVGNEELYPPAFEGAWELYAQALELEVSQEMYACPDNIEYVDAATGHILLNQQFYNAVAGRAWCWFKFNASGLLDSWTMWDPLPEPDERTRLRSCINSEVYSLHLMTRTGIGIRQMLGDEILLKLLPEATKEDLDRAPILTNKTQVWFFYDRSGAWRQWSTYSGAPFNMSEFPITSDVRPEYDVRGAAAICRVHVVAPCGLLTPDDGDDSETHDLEWSAGAKPLGTVTDADGDLADVTAFNGFVTSAFTENARLVPIDAVGARDLATADVDWALHVRDHLRPYLAEGVGALAPNCYFCTQLRIWEDPTIRSQGREYLQLNGDKCVRPTTCGSGYGGTAHGH